jgi:hypothetical protein
VDFVASHFLTLSLLCIVASYIGAFDPISSRYRLLHHGAVHIFFSNGVAVDPSLPSLSFSTYEEAEPFLASREGLEFIGRISRMCFSLEHGCWQSDLSGVGRK